MTITDEQLKGNWAEQYIAGQLASHGCFIRQVTQGHDSGIDLYCETIKDNNPFLHFWCQIKTSKKWKGKYKQLQFTPKKKHREYWLKQPVPVFIFLVPDLRDKEFVPYYICSAFDLRLRDKEKINSFIKIEKPDDLEEFLEQLPFQTYCWELKDGKMSPLKTPNPEYVIHFQSGIAREFEPILQTSIRWTLWRLISDILLYNTTPMELLNKSSLNDEENRRLIRARPYVKTLETFVIEKNDQHYETYLTIGVYYELENEYEKSLKYYKKSLSIINRDPKLDLSEDPWKDLIEEIPQHIERVESKI